MIGRDSGPAFFFFLPFFAGALSEKKGISQISLTMNTVSIYLFVVINGFCVNCDYSHTKRFHSDDTTYAKNISDNIIGLNKN